MTRTAGVTIVGASAAGTATAQALRRSGYGGPLTLVGGEQHLPYERPPLSKRVLTGAMPAEATAFRDAGQLEGRLGLDLRLGVHATRLDARTGHLLLDTGDELACDAVVIATGVRARSLPGTERLAGVHTLRTLEDALALRKDLLAGGDVVVVGGGFLGTEVAGAARGLGLRVTLVTNEAQPLERVVGTGIGGLVAAEHRRHGVRVRCGQTVEGLLDADGRVTGVRLAGGDLVPADVVVVAVGSVPATSWLAGSGLDLSDGVGCDAYCSAAPGVFAAGDVARWPHPRYAGTVRVEHRTNASEQGTAVARTVLAWLGVQGTAATTPYEPVPYFWSDQYGWRLQAFGTPAGAVRTEVLRVEPGRAAQQPPRALALYGDAQRLLGVVGIGLRPAEARALRAVVAETAPWGTALDVARAAIRDSR